MRKMAERTTNEHVNSTSARHLSQTPARHQGHRNAVLRGRTPRLSAAPRKPQPDIKGIETSGEEARQEQKDNTRKPQPDIKGIETSEMSGTLYLRMQ
jgi:hypothetical protein